MPDRNEKGIQEAPIEVMPSIISAPSPNFWRSRNGHKILAIVDHITDGLMPGCLDWLCDPASEVSVHYLVTRAGIIYKLVDESDTAWHAGVVDKPSWSLYSGINPNYFTIGVEHEGTGDPEGTGDLTPAQYQASLWLHRLLVTAYYIPMDDAHIIGHNEIDSVNRADCPGAIYPWQQLRADLATVTPTMAYNGGSVQGQLLADSHLWIKAVDALALLLPGHTYAWDPLTATMAIS